MKDKNDEIKIKIHPTALLHFVCIACFSSWTSAFCFAAAMVIHETGHIVMAKIVEERISGIHLTPYGGIIRFENTALKGVKGFLFAAGGPLANLLLLMFLKIEPAAAFAASDSGKQFVLANVVMLFFNCMPVFPLDGGRMLFSIGYYIFSVSRLISILALLGMLLGVLMIGLACYGVLTLGILNSSLLISGAYLLSEAYSERTKMLAENAYTVFLERKKDTEQIRMIRAFHIQPKTPAIRLMKLMSEAYEPIFLVNQGTERYVLHEEDIYRLILHMPHEAVEMAIKNTSKCLGPNMLFNE